jgi:hypothetical protein
MAEQTNEQPNQGASIEAAAIELEQQNHDNQSSEREQPILAPADGGHQAWLLLAGCFVINVLIWGEHIPDPYTTKQSKDRAQT